MLKIRVLLLFANALAALSLSLISVKVSGISLVATALFTMFFYPLSLGLFVSSGGSGLCGLGLGGLFGLFALYLRVFGGVPRVEDLW